MNLRERISGALKHLGGRVVSLGQQLGPAQVMLARGRRPTFAQSPDSAVRGYQQWTPAMIRQAESSADAGNLRLAAALCETMLGDERVRGCLLEVRVKGLLGLPITFEASGDGRKRNRAIRALEVEEDWWDAFGEAALSEWMQWGILLGVGLAKAGSGDANVPGWKRIERKGGERVIPVLDPKHPQSLRFDYQKSKWFWRDGNSVEHEITPGDSEWLMFAPYGLKRAWARGAWRGISRFWLLKDYATADWGREGENAAGVRVGFAPEGTRKEYRDELASDLASLGRDAAIALPPGFDFKLVQAAANTWETFQAQINMANTAIAIALLGQNLSTEVQGGSYAAAQVHGAIKSQILRSDAEMLATALHDQALAPWAEFNFGDRRLAPWPVWDTTPPEDRKQFAETLKTAGEAMALWRKEGAPIDRAEYARKFGIPLEDNAEWDEPEPESVPEAAPEDPAEEDDAPPPEGLSRAVHLASGDRVPGTSGFVEGQQYADRLAEEGTHAAVKAMSPFLDEVLALVEGLEDGDDWHERARQALVALHKTGGDPEELEAVVGSQCILGELAGREAFTQDIVTDS